MLINQTNISNSRLKGLDIHKDLILFLITEYDTHGKAAFNFNTTCPHCGKPMKYLAQIQWDTLFDGTEGTLYIEFCPDCKIVSMQHQQT